MYFLCFADARMSRTTQQIARQADGMHLFDTIWVWDENNLDEAFCEKWKDLLQPSVRGFGYWVWKPWSILKALEAMPDGGILLYCDAGNHLNKRAKKQLLTDCEELKHDVLGIRACPISLIKPYRCLESRWTKGDTFDHFACRGAEHITRTPQIEANTLLIRRCDSSIRFVREWYQIFEDRFSLVDDTASVTPNMPDYERNLHDQSIFSVLFKLRGGICFPQGWTLPYILTNPVWALRDRTSEKPAWRKLLWMIIKNHLKYLVFNVRKQSSRR